MNIRFILIAILFWTVCVYSRQDTVLLDFVPKHPLITVGNFPEEEGDIQGMRIAEAKKILQGKYPQILNDTNQYVMFLQDDFSYLAFIDLQTNVAVVYKKDDIGDYDFEEHYPLKRCIRQHILKEREDSLCVSVVPIDKEIGNELKRMSSNAHLVYSVPGNKAFYQFSKNKTLIFGSSIFDIVETVC